MSVSLYLRRVSPVILLYKQSSSPIYESLTLALPREVSYIQIVMHVNGYLLDLSDIENELQEL